MTVDSALTKLVKNQSAGFDPFTETLVCTSGHIRTSIRGGARLEIVSEHAILNANYLQALLKDTFDLAYDRPCAHEFVVSSRRFGEKSALNIAKRLMDYGFHPPTIYFPLIVPEALMIEPTETESKETLDRFVLALKKITSEIKEDPEMVKQSPLIDTGWQAG